MMSTSDMRAFTFRNNNNNADGDEVDNIAIKMMRTYFHLNFLSILLTNPQTWFLFWVTG